MKIFVGSSSEAKNIDIDIRKLLENQETSPLNWRTIFTPGEFGIESLERVLNESDAALLITTPDDKIWYRGSESLTPRDNILFELGFFMSKLGRERVGLVVAKNKNGEFPKLPTDLAGLNYIDYQENKNANNEDSLTKWVLHLKKSIGENISKFDDPFEILRLQSSKIPDNWKDDVINYVIEPFQKRAYNALSGEFSLELSQYYTSLFSTMSLSNEQTTIRAISVLAHKFWENDPFQAKYLNYNIQAKENGASVKRLFIINRNIDSGLWKTISKQLKQGIEVRVVSSKVYSKYSNLDDMVIIESNGDIRSYISKQFFSNTNRLKSANLNLNDNFGKERINSFDALWEFGTPPSPSIVTKEQATSTPPGNTMETFSMNKEVITCLEASEERGVPLMNELKSLILSTDNGYVAVHIPADGRISLRAIKNTLEVKKAHIASEAEINNLHLSPGTVSAVLDPVWSMPNLISKRVLTLEYVTTNNGTRSQYFKFDPIILLSASECLLGEFEE